MFLQILKIVNISMQFSNCTQLSNCFITYIVIGFLFLLLARKENCEVQFTLSS